jgi:hypothetical protein
VSTTSEASVYQALRGHLATLRLAAAAEALPGVLEAAREEALGHTAMLERLLGIEVTATEARRRASLERFASLPAPWRLADFDFDAQPSVDRSLVNELATLRFLEDATNVLFIGPPGVGKTMLAVALGRAAVEAGYRAYYTTGISSAKRLRAIWSELEARYRSDLPGSNSEIEDLRTRVLDLVSAAEAQVLRNGRTEPYGAEMMTHVRDLVRVHGLGRTPILPIDDRHLLGLVYQLTDECEVWWSERFELEAAV